LGLPAYELRYAEIVQLAQARWAGWRDRTGGLAENVRFSIARGDVAAAAGRTLIGDGHPRRKRYYNATRPETTVGVRTRGPHRRNHRAAARRFPSLFVTEEQLARRTPRKAAGLPVGAVKHRSPASRRASEAGSVRHWTATIERLERPAGPRPLATCLPRGA